MKNQSIIRIPIDQVIIQDLLDTKNIRVEAILDTKPINQSIKFYSDYGIDFILTGDFIYKVE